MQYPSVIEPRAVAGRVEVVVLSGSAESVIPVMDPMSLAIRLTEAHREAQYQRVVPPALGGSNGR
ncbi:hypothetical protein ACJ41P_10530 [Azospirillum argentinense]|uniref:Uncharacterized protein n=1 Tax=Azospirillum argentinense TaxID=2970906 RepID=A0ABW8V4Y4_9PROT